MFKALVISNLMVRHNDNNNIDGLVKHVANSKAWVHIDVMWLKFAAKLSRSQVPCGPTRGSKYGNAEGVGTWGTIPTSSTKGGVRGAC